MTPSPSEIKSRPVYEPLRPDLLAGRHWLVLEAGALTAPLLAELGGVFAPVASQLQVWWAGPASAVGSAVGLGPLTVRADLPAVIEALGQAGPFEVGDRLYVQGTEPFLWAVALAAGQVGLVPSQVRLAHAGSLQRKVWCTHCHGCTEGVTTHVVACAGCGRHLLVRDHFSRRHGAFMGVMVDAEVPGERPLPQEVFP
ncbi:conserved hypothetical protein [Leptothrix cholodnii SP-6]|uniref:Uncharacterized protein n=1 Tax=Leptothrix cholodnii (strain ATCC 51168 / LMG 8142 / SP-6) TaxID=395495 RepID=B1Y6W7_LEPCP|nr:dimethylamine monooxygenase subunit DmmA family protein [Leptothrix cholodnii]ACB32445.1 conserved hypothetical protein [Leptothrix cholodnii SP-6]